MILIDCEVRYRYLIEATLPAEAHTLGGAPATVWTWVTLTPPTTHHNSSENPQLGLDLEYHHCVPFEEQPTII